MLMVVAATFTWWVFVPVVFSPLRKVPDACTSRLSSVSGPSPCCSKMPPLPTVRRVSTSRNVPFAPSVNVEFVNVRSVVVSKAPNRSTSRLLIVSVAAGAMSVPPLATCTLPRSVAPPASALTTDSDAPADTTYLAPPRTVTEV
ncbi:MAG: hypothetical protein U1F43_18470 [Myxococcota bacterium]